MKELLNIKNYIYSKAILSKISENPLCLSGIHKGKYFRIFVKQKNLGKKTKILTIILEKDGKIFNLKHSREIVRILK